MVSEGRKKKKGRLANTVSVRGGGQSVSALFRAVYGNFDREFMLGCRCEGSHSFLIVVYAVQAKTRAVLP